MELNGHLYIGSPYNDFISKVKFINQDKIHPPKKVKREAEMPPTTTQVNKFQILNDKTNLLDILGSNNNNNHTKTSNNSSKKRLKQN